jgi:hypothetical protein
MGVKKDQCLYCTKTGHFAAECTTEQYLKNKEIRCGCNLEEIQKQRQYSTRKGMTTHCCICLKPTVIYKMNRYYSCEWCCNVEGKLFIPWRPEKSYRTTSPSPKLEIVEDEVEIEDPLKEMDLEGSYPQGHPMEDEYHRNISIKEKGKQPETKIQQVIENFEKKEIPTEKCCCVLKKKKTSKKTSGRYGSKDPNVSCEFKDGQWQLKEKLRIVTHCPVHNPDTCICRNKHAEYCGRHNHEILRNVEEDCVNCTWEEDLENRQVIRNFVGIQCPAGCEDYGSCSHHYCRKHRKYFYINDELCNECHLERAERRNMNITKLELEVQKRIEEINYAPEGIGFYKAKASFLEKVNDNNKKNPYKLKATIYKGLYRREAFRRKADIILRVMTTQVQQDEEEIAYLKDKVQLLQKELDQTKESQKELDQKEPQKNKGETF